ncbi:hypothetical protein K435DRAFT_962835 [Dendrothele bispora CBS 962.96]|uniref:Uncharacterized protein n=1 Tax=Dendrothele bispora (strain CBS 962.96) TaxID=1314807 RepID=A0A4S8MK78_DENBC|nr:hypothetical protein K435DRAFT_962835 [Dendrothele bispora CBS 962.96]
MARKCIYCGTEKYKTDISIKNHESKCPQRKKAITRQLQEHREAHAEAQQAEDELWEDIQARYQDTTTHPTEPSGSSNTLDNTPEDQNHDEAEHTRARKRTRPSKYTDFTISNHSALVKRPRLTSPELPHVETQHITSPDIPEVPTRHSTPNIRKTPSPGPIESPSQSTSTTPTTPHSRLSAIYRTEPDSAGLFRIFEFGKPSRIPDEYDSISELTDAPTFQKSNSDLVSPDSVFGQKATISSTSDPSFFTSKPPTSLDIDTYAPFDSAAEFLLMDWAHRNPRTSIAGLNELVHDVIRKEEFQSSIGSLESFSAQRSYHKIDNFSTDSGAIPSTSQSGSLPFIDVAPDAWYKGTVELPMPRAGYSYPSETSAPHFSINEVWYRKPMDAIRASFEEQVFFSYHLQPFKWFWKRSYDGTVERVYGEAYTSDRAAHFQRDLYNRLPVPPLGEPRVEDVIVWIMLWSDSTHLAQFGTASLWPIYMYIGNLSKYIRVKPSLFAAHHLAYIPSLPDLIKDKYFEIYGAHPNEDVMRFLKRELIHAIYFLLLDDEFRDAYLNGLLVTCADGILRRLFPRFFSYSADYPEKVLIACMKFLGEFLCPRCRIPFQDIDLLGLKRDEENRRKLRRLLTEQHINKVENARRAIFESGYGVESEAVKRMLDSESLTPIRNSFASLGVDVFKLISPEKLHEWDVGKVKDFVTQLVRILYSLKGDSISAFDRRFRWVPTFGRGVIRRFHNNVSGLKKLAGRDFASILECLMPVLEGLLPGHHDKIILDIAFDCLVWHCHAKLRQHTDTTLAAYKIATQDLGRAFRLFAKDTCHAFKTVEILREKTARLKREATNSNSNRLNSAVSKPRTFNNHTAKTHALGDYVWAIKYYGTTDSWDTKIGEQEHKRVKLYYSKTNKNKHAGQIARQERRIRCLRRMRERHSSSNRTRLTVSAWEEERLPFTDPDARYHMASGKRYFLDLTSFIHDHRKDPATVDFLRKLKHYILCELFQKDLTSTFSQEEYNALTFENNRIFKHKVVRINYTTYDLRRGQDSINPRTHPDIMVLAPLGSGHPFSYGRVIGVFHANVRFTTPRSSSLPSISLKRVDILWIRWFELDHSYRFGWKAKRLPRVKFVDADDPGAFGFLNPRDIVRAVHLIPSFSHLGVDNGLPGDSVGRQFESTSYAGPRELEDDDWKYYYVNMFVESDIFMLFRGGGIGHQELHDLLEPLSIDAGLDKLAIPRYDLDGEEVLDSEEPEEFDGSESVEEIQELDKHELNVEEETEEIEETEEVEDESSWTDDEEWLEWYGPEDGDDGVELEENY